MSKLTVWVWALAFAFWVAVSWRLAHSEELHNLNDPNHFYEYDCCNQHDCRPAKPGEVVEQSEGFLVRSTNQHFRYENDKVRYLATDGRYHVCQYTTSAGDFQESVPILVTRCLYVPPGGV